MSIDVTPPEVLEANKFRIEKVEFSICNPPEDTGEVDGDGNPVMRYAYTQIHVLDHMDGKPVRRLQLGNDALRPEDIPVLLGLFGHFAEDYAAATLLPPG